MEQPKARRCAIYTRKSSEEVLEQDFNSLHAQREACEAFIKSQTSEGWKLIKTAYDDGGISGGTMERPALQRLLADIGEGLIDVVVVYKVDADSQPLYVQGATKGRRRYRYYVSKCLVNGSASDNGKGWRLAAPEIERAVTIAARHMLSDRAGLLEALEKSEIDSLDVRATLESASNLLRQLQIEAEATARLVEVIDRAELHNDGISVTLRIQVHCSRAGIRTSSIFNLSRFVPLRMKRRGVETRIIMAAGDDLPRKVDPALLKAVARAKAWFEELASGRVRSLTDIARREQIAPRYVERLSRLAFAAPRIVEAICQGRQPADLNAETLLNRIDLPLEWSAQIDTLGID